MSHLLDDDDDDLHGRQNHRELTLSTGSILGIFFGLVLLCALFFAFGYNMGHRSAPPVVATSDSSEASSTPAAANFNTFKPAAGSPSAHAATASPATPAAIAAPDGTAAPAHTDAPTASAATTSPSPKKPIPASDAGAPSAPISHPAPSPTTAPAPAAGSFVVQVAAVSHQEDANLLVDALQHKGYTVITRNEPQDKLLHIQVGPFSNHKVADAMRQRLLADGYNAIVK